MKEVLNQLYVELEKEYRIDSKSWDIVHNPSNDMCSYMWCKENIDDNLLDEYHLWSGLIPLFKEYEIPYYHGIDSFVEQFEKFYIEYLQGKRTLRTAN